MRVRSRPSSSEPAKDNSEGDCRSLPPSDIRRRNLRKLASEDHYAVRAQARVRQAVLPQPAAGDGFQSG